MTRRDKLEKIFENVDENQRALVAPLIDEVIFLENRMMELRNEPFIRYHPKDRSMQKTTAAAKQYKECSQSYMNAIRILSGILRNAEGDADDDLLARLEEFSR
jgi:hypothetical protein